MYVNYRTTPQPRYPKTMKPSPRLAASLTLTTLLVALVAGYHAIHAEANDYHDLRRHDRPYRTFLSQ